MGTLKIIKLNPIVGIDISESSVESQLVVKVLECALPDGMYMMPANLPFSLDEIQRIISGRLRYYLTFHTNVVCRLENNEYISGDITFGDRNGVQRNVNFTLSPPYRY